MLSEDEVEAATTITAKELQKALNAAKDNSKELIEAEIDYDYIQKSIR